MIAQANTGCYFFYCNTIITTISQAAELGDTGRQVVLWVAMGLALWQLLMFAASTFVKGKNLASHYGIGMWSWYW